MSEQEAKEIVELVIDELVARGHITEGAYGRMPASLSSELAEKVVAKCEE